MERGGKVIALGRQTVAQELHPTTHLKGSSSLTLPSAVGTSAWVEQILRQTLQPLHSSSSTVWNQADLAAEAEYIGALGSPTIVSGLDEAASRERKRIILEGSVSEQVEQLVAVMEQAG